VRSDHGAVAFAIVDRSDTIDALCSTSRGNRSRLSVGALGQTTWRFELPLGDLAAPKFLGREHCIWGAQHGCADHPQCENLYRSINRVAAITVVDREFASI